MTTPRQPPAGPSEALPAQAEGADARSPEAQAAHLWNVMQVLFERTRCESILATAIVVAESRGAKAALRKAIELVEFMVGRDTRYEVIAALEANMPDAQRPSGSPSVPAAQPKDQANQGAPIREAPAPLASLAAPSHPVSLGKDVWIGEVRPTVETLAAASFRLPTRSTTAAPTPDLSPDVWHGPDPAFYGGPPPPSPRAAPSAVLPREAPEPGGTLAEARLGLALTRAYEEVAEQRNRTDDLRREVTRLQGLFDESSVAALREAAEGLLEGVEDVSRGDPSPDGNEPFAQCIVCAEDLGDPEQIDRGRHNPKEPCAKVVRALSDPPRAAPTDSAPATPGLGPPSAGSADGDLRQLLRDFLNAYENVTPGAIPWLDRWVARVRAALRPDAPGERITRCALCGHENVPVHPTVRCLRCGHEWESKLPLGRIPKQCGLCLGKSETDNGETMIVVVGEWSGLRAASGEPRVAPSSPESTAVEQGETKP